VSDLNPKIFKAYDIRGIYPTDINEENVVPVTTAIYKFFAAKLSNSSFTIAIGRDMRVSSPVLFKAIVDTFVSCGANVVDLGLVSTPTFYFAVSHFNYDTGLQITASHNPGEYNGLKFVLNTPTGLLKIGKPTGMEDIKEMALTNPTVENTTPGTVTQNYDVVDLEVENALTLLGNPEIKPYKVVADPANAMAALYIEALYKKIPGELIKMNFELDGTFPAHQADPMQVETLVELQKRVVEEKADFGLAPDGDGDRLFFIDEKGQVVQASLITALVAAELLKKNPGAKVVTDLKFILTPKKVIEEHGGQHLISKTGHAFITELMTKEGALFAGEASAHYYYASTGNAESQLCTIVTVLKELTEKGEPLSKLVEEFRRSYESGEINFEVSNAGEIIDGLKEKYADGEYSDLDGVAVTYPTWRFVTRMSNTEPLLRFAIEADTKDEMESKRDELVSYIKSIAKMGEHQGH